MENDDRQIGYVLSRREALKVLGLVSAALLAGCAPEQSNLGLGTSTQSPTTATLLATATGVEASTQATATSLSDAGTLPSCVVKPELTEGPYFVDEMLNRSDIRSDPSDNSVKEGAPFDLTVHVSQINGSACAPLEGAQVDIWHCDALGIYSDATDPTFGSTVGQKFLRGYQLTDSSGIAKFTTIYPGWYQGQAVHIHFKIRTPSQDQNYDFTSQFFFDEALSELVYVNQPYATKGSAGMMTNNSDGIFQQSGGQTLLEISPNGDGYTATFDIGLQF